MTDIARKLAAPFDPDIVSWRVGPTNQDKSKGIALAYLDARDVMRRLDDVCGPFGWGCDHVVTGDMVTCHIRILDPETGIWVSKSDGAGKTDVEGEKGSYSDSLKRAAVQWSVGRYLYNVDSPWVPIEARGKSFIIPDSERTKLANLLRRKFPSEAPQKPADASVAPEAPEPRPNGKSAPAPTAALPPANPEEPPEVGKARADMKLLLMAFREAPTDATITALWERNTKAVEGIKRYGGEAAFALLSDAAQKRLDELRAT